jgi:hypothetical protein
MIDKILNCFNTHNNIYKNIDDVINKPTDEFIDTVKALDKGTWKFANFQHLIVYGSLTTNKEFLVNLLLEKIYGKSGSKLTGESAGRQIWYCEESNGLNEMYPFSAANNPNSGDNLFRNIMISKWKGSKPNINEKPTTARNAGIKA